MEMSKEAQELRREYQRNWNKANPDKVKKNTKNYWERKVSKLVAKQKNEG